MRAAQVLPIILACTILGATGCGSQDRGLKKVIVQGTVTFDDVLISNGEIRFYPIEGTSGPVSGAPIKDGKFVARGRGGVPVGKHQVEILGYRPPKNSHALVEGGPVNQYLPTKYNSETTLIVSIDETTTSQDFVLVSQ